MKFNCGPDRQERFTLKRNRLRRWHRFFCLLPRRMTGTQDCRWLEYVERKGEYGVGYGGGYWNWEYRAP